MKRKTRNQLGTGLFVPAMALAGVSFAQSTSTSPAAAPATGAGASTAPQQVNPQDRTTTATPAGSAKTTDAQARDRAAGPSTSTSERSAQSADRGASSPRAQNSGAAGQQQPHALRASKLIGENVNDAQGDKLGEIKDLVIDANSRTIRYAVLAHGGVMGIGEKQFAYPVSMLKTKAGSDDLVLNVSKDKLENAPGFDRGKAPFSDNKYSGEVDRYYGAGSGASANAKLVLASDLIGKDIDDRSGKDVGEVEDLIVDLAGNRVQYAVVDFDDSWAKDSDGKLVAIPLESLTMPTDKDDKLVIDMRAEDVDMSRAFSDNRWPDFSEPTWRQSASEPATRRQAAVTR